MKTSELILASLLAFSIGVLYENIQRCNKLKEENARIIRKAAIVINKANNMADRWNELLIKSERQRIQDSIQCSLKTSLR